MGRSQAYPNCRSFVKPDQTCHLFRNFYLPGPACAQVAGHLSQELGTGACSRQINCFLLSFGAGKIPVNNPSNTYFVWEVEGKTVSILVNLDAIDRLESA